MVAKTDDAARLTARLHIKGLTSKVVYLIDTGVDISVVPKSSKWTGCPTGFKLFAVNG